MACSFFSLITQVTLSFFPLPFFPPPSVPFSFHILISPLHYVACGFEVSYSVSAATSIKCRNQLDYPCSLTQLFYAKIVKFLPQLLVWCSLHSPPPPSKKKADPKTRAFMEGIYFGSYDTTVHECRVWKNERGRGGKPKIRGEGMVEWRKRKSNQSKDGLDHFLLSWLLLQ